MIVIRFLKRFSQMGIGLQPSEGSVRAGRFVYNVAHSSGQQVGASSWQEPSFSLSGTLVCPRNTVVTSK